MHKSIPYLILYQLAKFQCHTFSSFARYQTKCVIKLVLRQLMTARTFRSIFDHPLKKWTTGEKRKKERQKIEKREYLKNENNFLDEIKSIFHNYIRAIIW